MTVEPLASEYVTAEHGLGRRQPEQGREGDRRPGRLRLRARHGGPGHDVLQAVLLPAGRQGRASSSTSASTAAGRSPTTTSTSCAGRSPSHWATALRRRLPHAERGGLRAEGDAHRREGRLRRRHAAVDVPASSSSGRWSASAPGAGWSASRLSPTLMDGGNVTAPNLAFWTPDGRLRRRERGRAAGLRRRPCGRRTAIAGKDPQLEKAIELALEALKKNPPKKATQPPFPHRVIKP